MTQEALAPIRAITRGPKFHWFAYYDKLQFDPSGRFVLGMEVDFEHRSPKPGDVVKVGLIDLEDDDRWMELGESRAWCWQQGCMLQWVPGSESEVIWNDLDGDRYVCHIMDVRTGKKRTLPAPVYSVSPDGRWAITPDFRRINHLRPGYGYAPLPDPNHDVNAPEDVGIWRVDLQTGKSDLILSLADIAKIPLEGVDLVNARHWFNHLLVNTDGTRIEFLHRWRAVAADGTVAPTWLTRMFTANPDGTDIFPLNPFGKTSHFIWRDPEHILAYADFDGAGWRFCLFKDRTREVEVIGEGVMVTDGHCTYLPGNEWILNDSYPDKERRQQIFLYHVATGRKVVLGTFTTSPEYTGEWRCDFHPRFSPDGRMVTFDSPHGGNGRRIYLIQIGGIVG
jgi:hypothetical protein